jgi:hypothetical protein
MISLRIPIIVAIVVTLSWGCQAPEKRVEDSPAAAPPRLIPRSTLFGNADRFQGRISPDGNTLSWLAPRDGVQNI